MARHKTEFNTAAPALDRTGRFAPSPTGPLHVGNLRTALLAWLFARSAGARFLVRVEDLDRSRVRQGVEEAQLADLRALGLEWDGPVVCQFGRMALYEEAIRSQERRVGKACRSRCSPYHYNSLNFV